VKGPFLTSGLSWLSHLQETIRKEKCSRSMGEGQHKGGGNARECVLLSELKSLSWLSHLQEKNRKEKCSCSMGGQSAQRVGV
jgi:hypothetical protein